MEVPSETENPNPSTVTTERNSKTKGKNNDFVFCKVCRLNHNQGIHLDPVKFRTVKSKLNPKRVGAACGNRGAGKIPEKNLRWRPRNQSKMKVKLVIHHCSYSLI
ncbi:hypothetical protein L1987_22898 [Smallanthus sonchifolius]|uniref:Uncharacterized protein n=1 Tax=Smallanthus sonchifolius TaxID=185202 RepID=A0ACB9IFE6_9ASTR|nr:hypothetical protein L1987_22898 [Smallanthus sonchifolius]